MYILGENYVSGKRHCEYKQIQHADPSWLGRIEDEIELYVFDCINSNKVDGCICWGISEGGKVVGVELSVDANNTLSSATERIENKLRKRRAGIPKNYQLIRKSIVFETPGNAKGGFFIIEAFSPPKQQFIQGASVSSTEGLHIEFKEGRNVGEVQPYAVACLNSGILQGCNSGIQGCIYLGIDDSGVAQGIRLSQKEMDRIGRDINGQIRNIVGVNTHPAAGYVTFHSVLDRNTNDAINELYVVEVSTPAPVAISSSKDFFTTSGGAIYIRQDSENTVLTARDMIRILGDDDDDNDENGKAAEKHEAEDILPNPYSFSAVATGDMFKGRDREIAELMSTIQNGGHRVIYGLQRMGKTSLIKTLEKKIGEDRDMKDSISFITVNFQEFGGQNTTYWAVLNKIIKSIAAKISRRRLDIVTGHIDRWVNQNQASIGTYEMRTMFTSILENTLRITKKRIVLFLDEFSELCHAIHKNENNEENNGNVRPDEVLADVDLMRWFTVLIDNTEIKKKLVPIIAARPFVSEYDDRKRLNLLKLMNPITLDHLDENAAKALITEPLNGKVVFKEECVDYLYKLTAGHPYLIQFFLSNVVNSNSQTVELQDVQQFENKMISEAGNYAAHFNVLESDYSLNVLDKDSEQSKPFSAAGKHVLTWIASEAGENGEGWVKTDRLSHEYTEFDFPVDAETLLQQLENAKILERNQGLVRISVPLLRKKYFRQRIDTNSLGDSDSSKVVTISSRSETGVA